MNRAQRIAVPLLSLAFCVVGSGCGRHDESSVTREPLARAAAAPSAVATPAGGVKPARAESEAPVVADPPARPKAKRDGADDRSEPFVKDLPKSAKSDTTKADAPSSTHATASGIKLKRLVMTRAIEHREPAETTRFTAGNEPVFAFIELSNELDEPGEISVSFEHDGGKSVGHVKLAVPEKTTRWRTWGKTKLIKTPGTWTAVVRAADGTELARKSFEVSEG